MEPVYSGLFKRDLNRAEKRGKDIASGYFAVNAEVVVRLYRAALSNPLLTGIHRNQIIAEFGNLPPEIRPKAK